LLARAASVLIGLAVTAAPVLAAADAPHPYGYEERCTLENAQGEGEECVAFESGGGRRLAAAFLSSHGFCARCFAWGASHAQAIMCRRKGSGPPLETGWEAACEAEERREGAVQTAAQEAWERRHCRPGWCDQPHPSTESFRPAQSAVLGWPLSNAAPPECPTAATTRWTLESAVARAVAVAAAIGGGSTLLVLGAAFWSKRRRQRRAGTQPSAAGARTGP
jgi:hypothetical protein